MGETSEKVSFVVPIDVDSGAGVVSVPSTGALVPAEASLGAAVVPALVPSTLVPGVVPSGLLVPAVAVVPSTGFSAPVDDASTGAAVVPLLVPSVEPSLGSLGPADASAGVAVVPSTFFVAGEALVPSLVPAVVASVVDAVGKALKPGGSVASRGFDVNCRVVIASTVSVSGCSVVAEGSWNDEYDSGTGFRYQNTHSVLHRCERRRGGGGPGVNRGSCVGLAGSGAGAINGLLGYAGLSGSGVFSLKSLV